MKKLIIIIFVLTCSANMYSQDICLTQTEKDVIKIINQKRSENGLVNLKISPVLMLTANKNAEEIITESYLSHKPQKFGDYNYAFEQIRYTTSLSGAIAIANSLTAQSSYTNYHDIIFQQGEYDSKNWQSLGISVRGSTVILILGEKPESSDTYNTCSEEVFFNTGELLQNPLLCVKVSETAQLTVYSVKSDGSSILYDYIFVRDEGVEWELKDDNAVSFTVYISQKTPPIVPQERIEFVISNTDKKKVEKTISFKGNTVDEIRDYINSGNGINSVMPNDPNGYTMLHRAVIQDNIEAAKYLIESGADINLKGYDGESPIFFVSSNEMFDLLLKHNPRFDFLTSDKTTILHSYAQIGLIEPVHYIVENNKVDINAKDRSGGTALMYAVDHDQFETAKYLLENGALQTYGWLVYPIHDAVENSNFEMVKLLVEYGADVNCKNGEGETPLGYAKQYPTDKAEIIDFLIEKGGR
ncbi:MAG TPA: ankyrin repeat domain-containing protein [Bacteroidales bacterium]|nr:ankyrin repeat domain-containing protein [Bacteroidales bacterium]